ncbi:hypothetical protein HUG10_21395 (plasmid) [Halorarum halophilum]|uniref:Homeodomain-like domain-containing protein n=1 Tax=Halorarum halophilum TaxID=2743090 RepID=A0A7D5GEY9_9EURY|nr:transposase [Halobaculum halophilum]QLG30145.1 hypothetical protein HUG10_21395 [Halobaculum halophilum]
MSNTATDATIDSRDDIPDRDELVELRRNQGLTNEDIAERHITEFSPRQIGIFASMYGIKKGWKDAEYLREQIENGVTVEELAEQWPVTENTVRNWLREYDIDENPLPDAFTDAIEALEALQDAAEEYGGDDLKRNYDEYVEIANQLQDDFDDWKNA